MFVSPAEHSISYTKLFKILSTCLGWPVLHFLHHWFFYI